MKQFFQNLDAQLIKLNTHFTAFLGAAIFVPCLTLLTDDAMATAVVGAVLPHVTPLESKFIVACIMGGAGYLLYLGKPHTVTD